METRIEMLFKPKLKNPVLIEGLPGIGNVGRVVAGYIIDELGAKKFAELISPYFMPFVLLHHDVVHPLKNEFYYLRIEGGRDMIILTGDCQAADPGTVGQYEIANKILDFVAELGVRELFTLGGFSTHEFSTREPKVFGAVSHSEMIKRYSGLGIDFKETEEKVGMIVGATGLLIGLGKKRGMRGICLMGETAGFPILTDPKAAEAVLKVLMRILNFKVDLKKINRKVREMGEFLRKLEKVHERALLQMREKKSVEKIRYIG